MPYYLDIRPCTGVPFLVLAVPPQQNATTIKSCSTAGAFPCVCQSDDDILQVMEGLIQDGAPNVTVDPVAAPRSVIVSNRRVKVQITPRSVTRAAVKANPPPNDDEHSPGVSVAIVVRSSCPSQWTIKQATALIPLGHTHEVVVSLRKTLRSYTPYSKLLITARIVRAPPLATSAQQDSKFNSRASLWRSLNVELDPKGPDLRATPSRKGAEPEDIFKATDAGSTDVLNVVVPCFVSVVQAAPLLYDRLLLQYHKHNRQSVGDGAGPTKNVDNGKPVVPGEAQHEITHYPKKSTLRDGESESSDQIRCASSSSRGDAVGRAAAPSVQLMRLVENYTRSIRGAEKVRHMALVSSLTSANKKVCDSSPAGESSSVAKDDSAQPESDVAELAGLERYLSSRIDDVVRKTAAAEMQLRAILRDIESAKKGRPGDAFPNKRGLLKRLERRVKSIPWYLREGPTGRIFRIVLVPVLGVLQLLLLIQQFLFAVIANMMTIWNWASQYNWAPVGLTTVSIILTWLIGLAVASGKR